MITINIKPTLVVAKTKQELMKQIRNNWTRTNFSDIYYVGSGGVLYTQNGMRRLYNIHKVNKKTIQHKYKSGPKKGQTKKVEVLKEAHWVGYVYTLTKDQYDLFAKAPIKQDDRNFVIGKNALSYRK